MIRVRAMCGETEISFEVSGGYNPDIFDDMCNRAKAALADVAGVEWVDSEPQS